MNDSKSFKQQRDRFVAFAFASADLFLEVDADGIVSYALGAARSLTGIDHEILIGRYWLDLFAADDRITLTNMHRKARMGQRCGPFSVSMDETLGIKQDAIVTAIRVPESDKFYVTIGFTSVLMNRIAENMKEADDYHLLDKNTFLYAAKDALNLARSLGQELEMTLLDIANTEAIRKRMGDDVWGGFTAALTDLLGSRSIDGQAVAQITQGRYSVIHDKSITSDDLREQLYALTRESDPEVSADDFDSKTVSADLQSLSEREAMKALIYTINEFERKGTAINIDTLNVGFKAYVGANAQKIHEFKSMVQQLRFDFDYLPIVHLKDYSLSHFEMLTNIKKGESTREWLAFGEDIGMAADFDIAVCERAINYLMYKSSGHSTKFAVNLSGQSIQNEQFFKTLFAKLMLHKELANRMIFEITDSTAITELDMVNHFIKTLQAEGFRICLDDFGAASHSLQYLQNLHVDYVKIDGQYTQKVLTSERDALLVKNLARMCQELNVTVIAERIETQAQADFLKSLDIPFGQGYLFGKPTKKPEYNSPKLKAS